MGPSPEELVEAALFEQHRWECSCEAIYRFGLGKNQIDGACLSDMLQTFGVARTLSKAGKVTLEKKLPEIAECHKATPKNWEAIFRATGPNGKSASDGKFYIEGSPQKNRNPRAFVSGLTKVLWFAGSHQMPMFDSLTCNAVKPKGDTQCKKAINFYTKLEETWRYSEAHRKLSELTAPMKIEWDFFPERFIDKLLLFKGLKPREFSNRALMGTEQRRSAYLRSLLCSQRTDLKNLVNPIRQALRETTFFKELAK